MSISEIKENEIGSVFELLRELRTTLTREDFYAIYAAAKKADQYTFYGYFINQECVGLMGLRFLQDFVHHQHLYIDDLVVKKDFRSKGVGAILLEFAEDLAKAKSCTGLRLCTGIDNKAGIRFYERENWAARALAFKKKL